MGIERFFNSLAKYVDNEKCIISGLTTVIDTEAFYIDCNAVIHNTVLELENDINYLLYSIIEKIHSDIEFDEKSQKIATEWKFELNDVSLEKYKTFFTNHIVDEMSIKKIKNHFGYILKNVLVSDNLRLLYIAVDGVPHMAKIVEQKKRRYNGYIFAKMKENIYNKMKNSMPEKRKLYEENKISYDKNKIISWSEFMKNSIDMLKSDDFKQYVKEICINIDEIIVSDQKTYGEGEKKIMEHILEKKKKYLYTIYSPDADIIVLSIVSCNILNNSSKIQILRYNTFNKNFDYVDVNLLMDSIYIYATTKGKLDSINYAKENVTNDLAFLFTFFGNDFVPKMESLDVRNDIEMLISLYCESMLCAKKKYIIFFEDNKYRINYYNLYEFVHKVARIENDLLCETFMINNYKNYNYYKREFNSERLYHTVKDYVPKANDIFDMARKYKELKEEELIKTINNKYNTDMNFMKLFMIAEFPSEKIIYTLFDSMSIEDIQKMYELHISELLKRDSIEGKLKFHHFDTNTVKTERHLGIIKDDMLHPNMEITEYDIEIYKMDKKIGQYKQKLNADDLKLGSIDIHYNQVGNYKLVTFNKLVNIANYYDTVFQMAHNFSNDYVPGRKIMSDSKEMIDVVDNYIVGLFWVFDYYFNKNDRVYNSKHISTWFYKHHRAPLMFQIRDVLEMYKKSKDLIIGGNPYILKMNQLFNNIAIHNKINIENYMEPLEHYLYVTPKNKHYNIPDKYVQITSENSEIFPDLDLIINKILENDDTTKIIDSKRTTYLSKSNLTGIKFIEFDYFMKIIRKNN